MKFDDFLKQEQNKPYYISLQNYLNEAAKTKTIYPPKKDWFKAFKLTPMEKVKIVLIGQDPYFHEGEANGLAFSTGNNYLPPSLRNIYKELKASMGIDNFNKGTDLSSWAKEGVLLLNEILTVEKESPLSHQNIGWEEFVKNYLIELEKCDQQIVYLLLGSKAKSIDAFVINPLHSILYAPHPSPLSAYRGFFGSDVFKKACDILAIDYHIWEVK